MSLLKRAVSFSFAKAVLLSSQNFSVLTAHASISDFQSYCRFCVKHPFSHVVIVKCTSALLNYYSRPTPTSFTSMQSSDECICVIDRVKISAILCAWKLMLSENVIVALEELCFCSNLLLLNTRAKTSKMVCYPEQNVRQFGVPLRKC